MAKWEEQLLRIIRWERRLWNLMNTADTIFDREAESYADDFYSCYLECCHMKEWLKKDREFNTATNREIEEYVNNTPSLCYCVDLANQHKHCNLWVMTGTEKWKKTNRNKDGEIQGLRFSFAIHGVPDDPEKCELIIDTEDAVGVDRIKDKWIKCGMDSNDIKIQVFSDVLIDGEWGGDKDKFDGAYELASEAVNAWMSFVEPKAIAG